MKKIVVVGSTGRTGRMFCSQFLEQTGGNREYRLVLAGRDKIMLERMSQNLGQKHRTPVDILPFDFNERTSLRIAIEGADLVVSCVGPYAKLGLSVVGFATQGKTHYLDASIEPAFFEKCTQQHDAKAKEAGVAVVNGLNATVGVADLAASVAAQGWGPVSAAHVMHVAQNVDAGLGERQTYMSLIGEPTRALVERRPQPVVLHSLKRKFAWDGGSATGMVFTGGEIISLPRHLGNLRDVYVYEPATGLMGTLGPLLGGASGALTKLLKKSWAEQGSDSNTDASRVVCIVELEGVPGRRFAIVSVPGLYNATAKLLSAASLKLLEEPPKKTGVVSPAEAFDAAALCKSAGLEVQVADKAD